MDQVSAAVQTSLSGLSDLLAPITVKFAGSSPEVSAVRDIWQDAINAPAPVLPPVWLHGDLHPANTLTSDGTLCGVVDFGDLCGGDPALDLASSWILLPDRATIEHFWKIYPSDEATWRRARGWAVWRSLGSLAIAATAGAGAKPSWGPPAIAALHNLTASI